MKRIYTSLDIGSDSIKVVVCELFHNKLNLLAASSVKSKGVKKGLIVNAEEATSSVKRALREVEEMLGLPIKKILVSVPSYFADFTRIEGSIPIASETVTGEDVVALFQAAMVSQTTPNKEMVTIIPIDFAIDDKTGIKDPKGLHSDVLKTRAIMVLTPKKNIYSVATLLDHMGIEVVDISINSIGDLYAFKNKEIDSKLGAIINIGSETTSVSLYNKGIIVKNTIIQLGGKNVDNDLSYIYHITNSEAIKIKEKFALAHKKYAAPNDFYETMDTSGKKIKISQFEASEIVMMRLEEILSMAKKEVNILTDHKIEYLIITGGVSNIAHFNYIAEEVFGKGVVIGNVKMVGIRNNKFSSAVGNIVYFIHKLNLKGEESSMFSKADMDSLQSVKKGSLPGSETMLGKVFGYFFNE